MNVNGLLGLLNNLNVAQRPPIRQLTIGQYEHHAYDYDGAITFVAGENRAAKALKVITSAARQLTQLEDLLAPKIVNDIFNLGQEWPEDDNDANHDARMAYLDGLGTDFESQILVLGLLTLRAGSNAEKRSISVNVSNVPNSAQLANGYLFWLGKTADADKILCIRAIHTAFHDSTDVAVRNAAVRLLGRGFTGIAAFVGLVRAIASEEGRQLLARIVAAYPAEVGAMIGTLTWLNQDPDRYHYAFYTGIDAGRGMKSYAHLAALGFRCMPSATMKSYRGAGTSCTFPAVIEREIPNLIASVGLQELPAYDANWLTVITRLSETATGVLTSL